MDEITEYFELVFKGQAKLCFDDKILIPDNLAIVGFPRTNVVWIEVGFHNVSAVGPIPQTMSIVLSGLDGHMPVENDPDRTHTTGRLSRHLHLRPVDPQTRSKLVEYLKSSVSHLK